MSGGSAGDTITGNAAQNNLSGNGGDDQLDGGEGADLLKGGDQNDILLGGNGADNLQGEAGNDSLDGGEGSDLLTGAAGNDSYVFLDTTLNQTDSITELAAQGNDTLDFAGMTTAVTVNLGSDSGTATMAHRIVKTGAGQAANIENATGGSANDHITGNASNNVLIGGNGNDAILGGGGDDILLGGNNNDVLKGISGKNILIGGTGGDILQGGTDEDVLLSGSSTFETDSTALNALLAEWVSGNPYQMRIDHLLGTTAGGANGTFTLTPTTAKNDASADTLTGNAGQDWFLANSLQDPAGDQAVDEVFTQINTWL